MKYLLNFWVVFFLLIYRNSLYILHESFVGYISSPGIYMWDRCRDKLMILSIQLGSDPMVCLISGGWFCIVFFGFQFAYMMGMHKLILSDPLIFWISLSWLWVFLLPISMDQTTLNLSDFKTPIYGSPLLSMGYHRWRGGGEEEDMFQDPQWKPEISDHMNLCIYYFFLYSVRQKYNYSSYGK